MDDKLTAIKASLVALFSGLAAFLGWKGILAVIWVACMALDYLSGTAAACKAGQWSSAAARNGLWHKFGMLIAVLVAGVTDWVLSVSCANLHLGLNYPQVVLPLVLVWYIVTELGSILENAVKLGAAVPEWLVKLMKAGLKAVDDAAPNAGNAEND